jgi:hypothetical protein
MNYLVLLMFVFNNLFFLNYSHALENKRMDIDLRLSPKNINNFSNKVHSFNNMKVISILNEDLSIISSQGEIFNDTYFDTNRLQLKDTKSSLRFRTRYKENKLISKLVQFKQKDLIEKNAYSEEKIDLTKESVNIVFPDQLKQFLIAKEKKNTVVKSIKKQVKLAELKPVFQVTQIRDRFYLLDNNNKVKFTISFDKSYYENGMDILPHQIVELEISEKLLQKASQAEALFLKKQLLKILEIFKEDFFVQQSTKYEMGIKLLKIEKKNFNPINTVLAIIIFLISAIVVFSIFYKGKKNG